MPTHQIVSIFVGQRNGRFQRRHKLRRRQRPPSVAVGDFNSDGKRDLAVANFGSDNVSILLGDGAGNFSGPTNFFVGTTSFPISVAVGDFNGDDKQDLALANYSSSNLSILLGDGAGHFSGPTHFTADTRPYSVAVGDFNGDGKQDLAVANYGNSSGTTGDNVSVLLGVGTGSFGAPTNFTVGTDPTSVAVGDFNGDGKQDFAVANSSSGRVSILLRNCLVTPTPTSVASRKTHMGAGPFDINLSLSGAEGVECRRGGE